MKICNQCKKEIPAELFIGRQAQCLFCRNDLHVCVNCAFYEPGTYNDCREGQAERVLDKTRSNFCDYFRFAVSTEKAGDKQSDPKAKLNALFKK